MPQSWPAWIAEAARTANRILSWLPNRIAEGLAYHVARGLLGCRDVTGDGAGDLIEDFQAHFHIQLPPVRFVELNDRAQGLLERIYGRFAALTWARTVYLSPGAAAPDEDGCIRDVAGIDTTAHELWHVHQFSHSGGGLYWVGRWLRERLRYGVREMPIELQARQMAGDFVSRVP